MRPIARIGFLIALLSSVAQAEESTLAMVPAGFDCFASLDARAVKAWPYLSEVLEQFPEDKRELEAGGLYPIGDIESGWWAVTGTGKGSVQGISLVRGKIDAARLRKWIRTDARGRFQKRYTVRGADLDLAQLAPRLHVVATPAMIEEVKRTLADGGKSLKISAREKDARALFETLSPTGGYRLVCRPEDKAKAPMRKKWPEASKMSTFVLEVGFASGLDFRGSIHFPDESTADDMLKSLQTRVANYRGGFLARALRLEAFFTPLEITRKGTQVEFHYPMAAPLVSRALAARKAFKELQQSSGDVVR